MVLTTPKALIGALWSAWSWYRYLQSHEFGLRLVIDGNLPEAEESAVRRLFPGVRLDGVESIVADLRRARPAIARFIQHHPLGKKLGLMLALSQQGTFLYSDHDVLAFNFPIEVLASVEKDTPFYMLEEHEGSWDPVIVELARSLAYECPSRFNSGLLYVPQGSLSLDLAEQLLASWKPPVTSWFAEQTVLGVLMCQAKATPLPKERYVVSPCRQFYWERDVDYAAIAARHFTGTVRHVMYKTGIPTLLWQSKFFPKEPGNA